MPESRNKWYSVAPIGASGKKKPTWKHPYFFKYTDEEKQCGRGKEYNNSGKKTQTQTESADSLEHSQPHSSLTHQTPSVRWDSHSSGCSYSISTCSAQGLLQSCLPWRLHQWSEFSRAPARLPPPSGGGQAAGRHAQTLPISARAEKQLLWVTITLSITQPLKSCGFQVACFMPGWSRIYTPTGHTTSYWK